ncbi:MAG: DedA family protein [Planctomycetaceae bacterium]|nr:DedA family protein [Planctomycetaceae bacterium]
MEDLFTDTIDSLGYFGVALLMMLENIFPPIPSEVVMPAAGASAQSGNMSLVGVIVAGTIGSIVGALPWYGVARWVGTDSFEDWITRHGHWLGTDTKEIKAVDRWFEKSGYWGVLMCRLIPGVRTLISVPAGLAEMPFIPFIMATTVGTAAWTALLAAVGYWLKGQSDFIATVLKYIGMGVIVTLFIVYVLKVVRRKMNRSQATTT